MATANSKPWIIDMEGIVNDPNAKCGMSIEDTIIWARAEMSRRGMKTLYVSREWGRRLEQEGFDMSLITVCDSPFVAPKKSGPAINSIGPRNRWGKIK